MSRLDPNEKCKVASAYEVIKNYYINFLALEMCVCRPICLANKKGARAKRELRKIY